MGVMAKVELQNVRIVKHDWYLFMDDILDSYNAHDTENPVCRYIEQLSGIDARWIGEMFESHRVFNRWSKNDACRFIHTCGISAEHWWSLYQCWDGQTTDQGLVLPVAFWSDVEQAYKKLFCLVATLL